MMNFGKVFNVCTSMGCTNSVLKGRPHCDQCIILREQHATSHMMEGHTGDFILHCPICDRLAQVKAEQPPPAFL